MGVKETWVSWKECDQVDSQGLRGVCQRWGLEETVPDKRKRVLLGLVELGASSVVSDSL